MQPDHGPRRNAAVDAHVGGRRPQFDLSGIGAEALIGTLRSETGLNRVTTTADVVLFERQLFAGCDPQLPLHDIEASDFLRHRMLDLQTGVHFEEEDVLGLGINHELHRADRIISDAGRELQRVAVKRVAGLFGQVRRGSFLKQFLIVALNRAISLEEMHEIAVLVAKDLNLDVARPLDQLFDQQAAITERGLRFATRRDQRVAQSGDIMNRPHPFAPAASRRFDHYRQADALRFRGETFIALVFAIVARRDRHACRDSQPFGFDLRSHRGDGLDTRPDPDEAMLLAELRQIRAFGQEAITGVNGIGTRGQCSTDDAIGAEIAVARGRRSDRHGDIGEPDMHGIAIRVRIDGSGTQADALCRANDADGDFASIGDEKRTKHALSYIR